ncbi:MAG TPA: zf-TFIIB domain-containing protein [Myxococcales bacterium]|nr:zf-TFIIB domain-containing protein [Myxococcales bacterium]
MSNYEKPSSQEEEYFAREEIEKKRKLALQQAAETEVQQREALQRLHFMKCPKCGMDLHAITKGKVVVDTCFNCHGVWLDAGEMERLLHGEADEAAGSVMRAILNFVRRK